MRKSLLVATVALLGAMSGTVTACGPRQVEVNTGPQPTSEVTLAVTNNASQAMSIYVINRGNEVFLQRVDAGSTVRMTVPGVAAGTTVKLKAVPVDGSPALTRDNVTLTGVYEWRLP